MKSPTRGFIPRKVTSISSCAKYDRALVEILLLGNGADRVGAGVGVGREEMLKTGLSAIA